MLELVNNSNILNTYGPALAASLSPELPSRGMLSRGGEEERAGCRKVFRCDKIRQRHTPQMAIFILFDIKNAEGKRQLPIYLFSFKLLSAKMEINQNGCLLILNVTSLHPGPTCHGESR